MFHKHYLYYSHCICLEIINCLIFSYCHINMCYLQVRVAGLVTTLVNVTGGRQGATNALAEDSTADVSTDRPRNGTTPKVRTFI